MPQQRNVIRKIERPGIADFDDQIWPINCALVVFAGFVAGIIIAYSDFQTSRLLFNGWARLVSLAVVMGLAAWGMVRLQGKWSRRMQLATLLGLLVHLWLGMYLQEAYLAMVLQMESRARETVEQQEIVTTYDYDFQTPDQIVPDESLADPLETYTPDVPPEEVIRREMVSVPTEIQPAAEPARTEIERPNPAQLQRAEVSAPRRSEALSGPRRSRSELEHSTAAPATPLPETELPPRPEPARDQTEVASLDPARAPAEVARRTQPSRLPDAQVLQPRPAIERRPSRQRPSTSQPTDPSPRQPLAAVTPRINTESPPTLPDTDASTQPARRPEAAVSQLQRQPLSAAALRPRNAAQQQETSADAPFRVEQPPSPNRTQQPQLASVTEAPAARTMNNAALPAVSPAPSQATRPAAAEARSQPLDSAVVELSRTPTAATPQATLPISATPEVAARAPRSAVSTSQLRRAERSGQTSIVGQSTRPRQLATLTGIAEPALPTEGSRSEPGTAQSSVDTPAEPPRTALARAAGGIEGLTRQRSYDVDLPAASQSISLPTAAARRNQSSDLADAAASPSRPAQIARARAATETSSAALLADDVPSADVAGSSRPAEIEASSSAAIDRVAAAAPTAQVTAAAGSSTIDFGAPRASPGSAPSRSAGGGQPTIATAALPTRMARAGQSGGQAADLPRSTEIPLDEAGLPAPGGAQASGLQPPAADVARGSAVSPINRLMSGPPATNAHNAGVDVASGSLSRAESTAAQPNNTGGSASSGAVSREIPRADVASGVAAAPRGAAGETSEAPTSVATPADADMAGLARNPSAAPSDVARPAGSGEALAGAAASMPAGAPVTATGPRRAASGENAAPAIPGDSAASALARHAAPAGLPSGAADADLPGALTRADAGTTLGRGAAGPRDGSGSLSRRASGPALRINADDGPGGLTRAPAAPPGLPSRRARPESEVVHSAMQRFVLERAGGTPIAVDAESLAGPVDGFLQRDPQQREALLRRHGGTEGSERAVEMGLDFLARHQWADGRWSLHNFAAARAGYSNQGAGDMQADSAATGLALLSFLGAGYTHTDGKYRQVVRRGLDHLLTRQKPDGDLFVPQDEASALNVWLYSHGIASIALCEAYGMTRDAELREPAQRALDFIVAAQHEELGGWRYSPRAGADTSVSGWQVMALKSGQLAGLEAPADTYAGVLGWLEHAQGAGRNPAYYAYRPRSNQRSQSQPSRAMTAEALLMRQYLGWNRDNPHLIRGADFLKLHLPTYGSRSSRDRDAYYWYYATQVMFQMQGEHWRAWNDALRPLLESTQTDTGQMAGSWDPGGEVPDRWSGRAGRIYVTCLHLLMLEVYYRHLPLYQDLN